ncbi:MAG: V-type ATPase subunit [Candidatus Methanomethylicia archaeon]|nr:V-type ATPase subunit [Candidatus Methanomethylicia archaeon]
MFGVLRYGFINTKIRGLKREYITLDKYQKLIEASYNDIVKILMDTPYGKELMNIGVEPTPVEFEKAFLRALTKAYLKVLRWLPKQSMRVIALHMMKYEIENIKTVLRLKTLNSPTEKLKQHVIQIPLGIKVEEYVEAYEKSKNLMELLKNLIEIGVPIPLDKIIKKGTFEDVTILEAELEKLIYATILKESEKLDSKSSKSMRDLIGFEVDLTNIKNTIRAKKLNMSWKDLEVNIITPTYKVKTGKIKTAFEKDDLKEMLEEMMMKNYSELLKPSVEVLEKGGLEALEKMFNKEIYKGYQRIWRRRGFQYDLSLTLAYLTRKWMEVKNLKIIVYCKHFGLPKQRIMEEIIV